MKCGVILPRNEMCDKVNNSNFTKLGKIFLTKEPSFVGGLSRTTPSRYSHHSLARRWWGMSVGFKTPAYCRSL